MLDRLRWMPQDSSPVERTQDMVPYLTTQEVATILGVRRETVIRWLNSGHLKGFKLGGRKLWRVSQAEVERFEKGEPRQ